MKSDIDALMKKRGLDAIFVMGGEVKMSGATI
jgi:hypothetical protein